MTKSYGKDVQLIYKILSYQNEIKNVIKQEVTKELNSRLRFCMENKKSSK